MELLDFRDYVKIRRSLLVTFTPLCPLGLSCVVQELPFKTLRSREMNACNQTNWGKKLLKLCLDIDLKMTNSKKSSKIVKESPLSNHKTVYSSALRSGGTIANEVSPRRGYCELKN